MRSLTPIEKQRGEQLAQFLNGDLDEYEKIGRTLQWCQEVYSLYVKRPPLSRSPERIAYERQQATLLTRVNEAVRKFEAHPRLEAHEAGLTSVWASTRPLHPTMVQALRAFKSGPPPIGPATAIAIILEMTVAGSITRIRQCENPGCQKWIMVTSTKRLTCSDDCRFAKYQMQKGSRANDMRRSRELHKNHPQLKKQSERIDSHARAKRQHHSSER